MGSGVVSKAKLAIALSTLSVATVAWAVPDCRDRPSTFCSDCSHAVAVERRRADSSARRARTRVIGDGLDQWRGTVCVRDRHRRGRFARQPQSRRASAIAGNEIAEAAGRRAQHVANRFRPGDTNLRVGAWQTRQSQFREASWRQCSESCRVRLTAYSIRRKFSVRSDIRSTCRIASCACSTRRRKACVNQGAA